MEKEHALVVLVGHSCHALGVIKGRGTVRNVMALVSIIGLDPYAPNATLEKGKLNNKRKQYETEVKLMILFTNNFYFLKLKKLIAIIFFFINNNNICLLCVT